MTPERIKAWPWTGKSNSGQWHVAGIGETTEYVRADLFAAQAAELATLREAMGNNCNALTDADRAYLIAHLSYELEPVGKPPTWNQLAMEVIRLSKDVALKGGA